MSGNLKLFPALALPVPAARAGKKHLRKIELQEWQQTIVAEFAGEFVRGLFHSDGYRGMNRVRRVLADGEHWYEYPRYMFSNKSRDILGLCGAALDRLEVEWRFARPDVISVAKRGEWQQVIVDRYPGDFARGLFHSDGYRGMNRVRRVLADGEHWYEYPRYLFSQHVTGHPAALRRRRWTSLRWSGGSRKPDHDLGGEEGGRGAA